MSRTLLGVTLAAFLLGFVVWLGLRSQRALEGRLPPRIAVLGQIEGFAAAVAYAEANGGSVAPVLGTGSMAPYIPASAPGLDPYKTVCAYVVTRSVPFASLRAGDLCVHHSPDVQGFTVLHVAASNTATGWIMTGLNNRVYDTHRMTEKDFVSLAVRTFVWPQI